MTEVYILASSTLTTFIVTLTKPTNPDLNEIYTRPIRHRNLKCYLKFVLFYCSRSIGTSTLGTVDGKCKTINAWNMHGMVSDSVSAFFFLVENLFCLLFFWWKFSHLKHFLLLISFFISAWVCFFENPIQGPIVLSK